VSYQGMAANSANAVMPTPSEMPEAMRTRSQHVSGICVEIIYGPLRRVQTGDEDMIHALANDKSGNQPDSPVNLTHCAMGVKSRFVGYVTPAAKSTSYISEYERSVDSSVKGSARHIGDDMTDGGELGGRCDANTEPSVGSGEIALVCTDSMACVETRCHPLPCGSLGDEGIVHSPANDKSGATRTSGVSNASRYSSLRENQV